jgi:hypothetical protein
MQLDRSKEWGFFINPNDFSIHELKGEIANESFIILRKRMFEEGVGKILIRSFYGIILNEKFVYLTKKELSERIAVQCAKFIIKNSKLPPRVTIEKQPKENKPVDLVYTFSYYDTFNLRITETMLDGKDPKTIIERIIAKSNKNLYEAETEKIWRLEYAPHGRELCKKCKRQIKKGEIRLGEPFHTIDYLTYKWYHSKCLNLSKMEKDYVTGIENLKDEDKRRIEKKLKNS